MTKIRNGMLIDTSALIAYASPESDLHDHVSKYISQAITDRVHLHVSSLVVSEFSRRQSIADLDQKTFIMDAFDIPEAILSAKLLEAVQKDATDNRSKHKIDLMLIAHAQKLGLASVLTADKDTLAKYCDRLRSLKLVDVHAIVLSEPFDPMRVINPEHRSLELPVQTRQ